jgi:hypothetical protein
MSSPISTGRKIAFSLLAIALVMVPVLVLTEYVLGKRQEAIEQSTRLDPGLIQYDPQLGWVLAADWSGGHSHHDFEVNYSTNRYRLRTQSADLAPPKQRPRIGVLGDSFTFGFGVEDDETFVELMDRADPERDFLNLAIPGTSTDQQYLLMRNRARPLGIDHYVLVFYLGNDLLDNALPYPLHTDLAKPFFQLDAYGRLELKNTPVPRQPKPPALRKNTLGSLTFGEEMRSGRLASTQLYRRLFPEKVSISPDEARQILEERLAGQLGLMDALLGAIKKEAAFQDAGLTIVLMPGLSWLKQPDSWSAAFQEFTRQKVRGLAAGHDLPVVDLAGALRSATETIPDPLEFYHPHEGHLNRDGHKLVAGILSSVFETSFQTKSP